MDPMRGDSLLDTILAHPDQHELFCTSLSNSRRLHFVGPARKQEKLVSLLVAAHRGVKYFVDGEMASKELTVLSAAWLVPRVACMADVGVTMTLESRTSEAATD